LREGSKRDGDYLINLPDSTYLGRLDGGCGFQYDNLLISLYPDVRGEP